MKSVQKDSIQVVTFYEKSSTEFRITLDQLDKDLKDLAEVVDSGNNKDVKIAFTLSYLQQSSLLASSGKREDKTFRNEVVVDLKQTENLVRIYSTLRNIGSENPERNQGLLSAIRVEVNAGVVGSLDIS